MKFPSLNWLSFIAYFVLALLLLLATIDLFFSFGFCGCTRIIMAIYHHHQQQQQESIVFCGSRIIIIVFWILVAQSTNFSTADRHCLPTYVGQQSHLSHDSS